MKQKSLIITIIIGIITAGLGFFGGMQYQKSQRPSFGNGIQNGEFTQGRGTRTMGNTGQNTLTRPLTGEIIAADDKSITVKMQDGSSKIILFSDSTSITQSETGNKTDLTNGKTVLVFGNQNSDGSVTAQSIQLDPMFRGGNNPMNRMTPSPNPSY